jgi:hypothetical protein
VNHFMLHRCITFVMIVPEGDSEGVLPMMELMATGRKARSRRIPLELVQRGFGILIIEAPDFPRAERDRLTAEIVAAFQTGALAGETLDPARRIANALRSPGSMLEGLRVQLQADGREMVAQIRTVSTVVPALLIPTEWIGLAA